MANFRLTLFYKTTESEGWSEKYFVTASTITAAQSELDTLIPLALAFRTVDVEMIYARVSDVAIRGDSLTSLLTFPEPGTYTPGAGAHDLEANTALLVEFFASSVKKNHMFVRGLTTDAVQGRTYNPAPGFASAITSWLTHVTTAPYELQNIITHGPPPTYSYTPVVSGAILGATARKPGRPFGLLRGRR